ncbi:flagellar basal-body MS-ring/collar protein FliF [Sedimentitalea todarodis]|uniref:Flagellar M-ring protein n=1 Tax=Sedimentitalea todarodis TaxID=1631240 RepID=A0ABU3VK60_9RHOB|nr:flagellar basal-body MS-ring/collar protein FliF [Sedimentitalea todarodis]MDU9006573.1 flagellar basal-body MS-ring/collar protein FliF [Sedimentitalea todarodis]
MQQIKTLWVELDRRKQMVVILATVAVIVTLVVMSRMAAAPSMQLLYAGLENGSAGDVVRALEQRGTLYEVRGGSIYVPAENRDELRMMLASEGLPANGGRGYELLDSLNGFGTTSQMFDAAYWRAKEGELARTVVASPHVAQARVHIAHNGSGPFQRSVDPTASVSVVPAGAPVTPAQANALRYLVASAVAGLTVENVAIIDANGTLIGTADTSTSPNIADDRASLLRDRVLRLVEARVGAGNAVVEVSVDTITQTESIRERRFDPEGRVAISTDTEERTDSSTNAAGGDVTVASNLPDGDGAGGEGSKAQGSETRERINYEVSETEHEIVRGPGDIRRLTVAVLVNGLDVIDETGSPTFQSRPDEELTALHDLVASAVGYDESRGDVITLKSMELPTIAPLGTAAAGGMFQGLDLDVMSLIQLSALALVALVLGLFVVRPILSNARNLPQADLAALPPAAPEHGETRGEGPVLTGEIDDGPSDQFQPAALTADQTTSDTGLPALANSSDSPVERLRSMIGERQEETVEILRSWLEESEEKA